MAAAPKTQFKDSIKPAKKKQAPAKKPQRKFQVGDAPIILDNNVAGPIALAAGANQAYLVYQLATGEVYATLAAGGGLFTPRLSLVSGQGSLPAAAPAGGPGIAFDAVNQRVVAAYPSFDGQNVVVVSSDPAFASGWRLEGTLQLMGSTLQPGLAMVSGNFGGTAVTVVYAVVAEGPKVVWAASPNGWSGGFQSVLLNGAPFNPPDCAGLAASMQTPDAGQIALAFTIGSQSTAFVGVSALDDLSQFGNAVQLPPGMGTTLAPGLMLQVDTGAQWALTDTARTVYYAIFGNGSWSTPQPIEDLSLSMGGAPAGVWNGFTAYVACVRRLQGELAYTTIVIG
ncbi:MAG: hypothetical protein QOD42_3806 [Sphingomonadales bacterium]|jgi:hypothetical protein|nr:hypothetical protein [Sphingomonadales bacterium]